MSKFCIISILAAVALSWGNFAVAQNVTVSEASSDEIVNRRIKPSVDKVVKIDNYAKKMAELQQKQTADTDIEKKKLGGMKNQQPQTDVQPGEPEVAGVPVLKEDGTPKSDEELQKDIEQKDLKEIEDNSKLTPQELLKKVREERKKLKEEEAAAPLPSNKQFNEEVKDKLKARREERRNMTKEERREVKEELKTLYKARREERRNFTKAERRAIKEEMKAKEKARRQQQREDRKKRRKMRDMD